MTYFSNFGTLDSKTFKRMKLFVFSLLGRPWQVLHKGRGMTLKGVWPRSRVLLLKQWDRYPCSIERISCSFSFFSLQTKTFTSDKSTVLCDTLSSHSLSCDKLQFITTFNYRIELDRGADSRHDAIASHGCLVAILCIL